MSNVKKELSKSEKKVRRLYALVWFLACPLAFVLATLLGFHQANIVYWTLLIVPVLLGIWNVRQVPPARQKNAALATAAEEEQALPEKTANEGDSGISTITRAKLIAVALKVPVVIAAPILVTLIVDIMVRAQK